MFGITLLFLALAAFFFFVYGRRRPVHKKIAEPEQLETARSS